MADIKVVGTDIVNGQNKPIVGGDIIRPETGDLTVSAGTTDLNAYTLNLVAGAGLIGNGGAVNITATNAGGTSLVGGSVTISAGNGTGGAPFSGQGGSVQINTGSSGSSTSGGDFVVSCGGPTGGTASGGNITMDAGTGSGGANGGNVTINAGSGGAVEGDISIGSSTANNITVGHGGSAIGFYATTPVSQATVTGSRGGNAALASFLTAMANLGLIIDGTTA